MSATPQLQCVSRTQMFALILTCFLFSACQSSDVSTLSDETAHPIPNAVNQLYTTDVNTLYHALAPVFKHMHWAGIKKDNQIAAFHATALATDGRTINIRAQQVSVDPVTANLQVKVGYFGDTALERQFHTILAETLRENTKMTNVNR